MCVTELGMDTNPEMAGTETKSVARCVEMLGRTSRGFGLDSGASDLSPVVKASVGRVSLKWGSWWNQNKAGMLST